MYRTLYTYRRFDSELADKTLAVLKRHGWYLTEQVVPFILFSNRVDSDTKSHVAAKLLTIVQPEQIKIGKPTFPEIKSSTKLIDLLGPKIYLLFKLLGVEPNWLKKSPKDGDDDEEYKKMQEFMRTVKTVNDCAERGVKMIKEYSKILKKDAGTRNWLLQGVELNRKKYPDFNIKTLKGTLSPK